VDANVDLNLPVSATAAITDSFLHAYDPDTSPDLLVFSVVTYVTQGTLKLNGAVLSQGSTFTQQDINNSLLTYAAPASTGTDGFTFHVSGSGGASEDLVFTIHNNKPEPVAYPTIFTAVADSTSQITTTWTDASGGTAPDGYLVLCAPDSDLTPPTDTADAFDNTCGDGSGRVHVEQGVGTLTWVGLYSETDYHFAIFPYSKTTYTQTSGAYFDYLTAAGAPTATARTLNTYSISGTIADDAFTPLSGVLVDAGGGHTAISGEDGSYTITGLVPGGYVLSASLPCYTFEPGSLSVTVSDLDNHPSGNNFTGTRWMCINGTVLEGANPLADVVISDGSGHSSTTLADGSYSVLVPYSPASWSGVLAPAKLNYFFSPDRRTYTNITTDQYVQGYTGFKLAVSYNRFTAAWAGTAGATGYYLEVATDPDFNSFVPGYQTIEVGNVTEFEVTGLDPHTHYFFRVRAHDWMQTGGYSIPTEVLTNLVYYFPVISR